MELGVYTFGDITPDPATGRAIERAPAPRRDRRRAEARRRGGLDVFGVGEVYEKRAAPTGAIFVGSPQQIVDKLMYERELFGQDRFLGQVDLGGMPYAKVAMSIELLATKVLPAIRG